METTLYDCIGDPIYCFGIDNAIYYGMAMQYAIYNNEKVYGWRGKHIGWCVDGLLYDEYGHRVGFLKKNAFYY